MNNYIKIKNLTKKYQKNKFIKVLNDISFNFDETDLDIDGRVSGSGWIIKSHEFMDVNMDYVSNSFVRSYFEGDKYINGSLCNVKNEEDDYCLLHCYYKWRDHIEKS